MKYLTLPRKGQFLISEPLHNLMCKDYLYAIAFALAFYAYYVELTLEATFGSAVNKH